ncbi:MAG: NUDIX hydrolase [Polaromonas sp.]
MQHPIIVTIDVVLLALAPGGLQVALQRRAQTPFAGVLALPGGYVRPECDANTFETAARVLKAKAGVTSAHLEQLVSESSPDRDPRGWSLSVVYLALVPLQSLLAQGGDVLELCDVDALPALAFDHAHLISKALERLRNKAAYSTLPLGLMPETFTLAELQRTYEQVMGVVLNKSTFRARMAPLILEPGQAAPAHPALYPTGDMQDGVHRPARLFRKSLVLNIFESPLR